VHFKDLTPPGTTESALKDMKASLLDHRWTIGMGSIGKARGGQPSNVNLVRAIDTLLRKTAGTRHVGNPHTDWTQVKKILRASGEATRGSTAEALDYLVA